MLEPVKLQDPERDVCPVTCRSISMETALLSDTEEEDSDVVHYHLQRKQRRKTGGQSRDGEDEPPIIRGLWVQEIDWLKSADREMTSSGEIIPPPPQFTDSLSHPCSHGDLQSCAYEGCSCADVCGCVAGFGSEDHDRPADPDDTSSTDEGGGSDSDCDLEQDSGSIYTRESESDSSYSIEAGEQVPESFGVESRMSNLTFGLMHVSGFNSSSHAEWQSDSAGSVQSLLGSSDSTSSAVNTPQCPFGFDETSDTHTVLDVLRGRVTQMPKLSVSPFFKDLIKQTLSDWKTSKCLNEGLIFHHVRHPLYTESV